MLQRRPIWSGIFAPYTFISRADTAAFMLEELAARKHVRQAPMIGGV